MNEKTTKRNGCLQREKSGIYIARVSVGGCRFARSTATKNIEEAKRFLAAFVAEIEMKNDAQEKVGPLMKYWSCYLGSVSVSRLSPAGIDSRRRAWRYFTKWMYSVHPEVTDISAISHRLVEEFMFFYGKYRAAMTQKNCIVALRDIFSVLCFEYNFTANPLESISTRNNDSRMRRELSIEEVRRLHIAAQTEGGEWPLLLAIATYTGMRLGDCCHLAWDNVNLTQGIIQIVPHKTRRYAYDRPITIPIHAQLRQLLVAIHPVSRKGFVLPEIAAEYDCHRWRISKVLARIFDRAYIVRGVLYDGRQRLTPNATFHSLRHSFVSFAANAGVPLVIVQSIVGHTSSAMTRHYYHANETELRKAVEAIPSFSLEGEGLADRFSPAGKKILLKTGREHCNLSLAQRLKRVESLFARGLLSAQEHKTLRERILAQT